jgi:phosphoglucosamine mutase
LNLGGEQSGHVVFLDHATTGDGTVAALAIVAAMLRVGQPLSTLAGIFEPSPQELINVRVNKKVPLDELPTVQAVIAEVEATLGSGGRVLVRYSGTELKARVMIEGDDAGTIRAMAERIADALHRALA